MKNPRKCRRGRSRNSMYKGFTYCGCHGSCLRSEEHTSELQSPCNLVCRLLLEKKNRNKAARSIVLLHDRRADQLSLLLLTRNRKSYPTTTRSLLEPVYQITTAESIVSVT